MYRVFRSDWYEKKLKKLNRQLHREVEEFEQKLKLDPYASKQLTYDFFREKKFGDRRILFLIYEDHNVVFLVTIVDKKLQQHVIDMIKTNLDVYKEFIQKLMNKL
jgi:mRNA-degrading endonuclease RelE of RelBE toxin-antitoxin system